MHRLTILRIVFGVWFLAVIVRLGFWQLYKAQELQIQAANQYERPVTKKAYRGEIRTSDGYTLVGNTTKYQIIARPFSLKADPTFLSEQILSVVSPPPNASPSAILTWKTTFFENVKGKLSDSKKKWVSLATGVSQEEYEKLRSLLGNTLEYQPMPARLYPEGTLSAHLTGFLGQKDDGSPVGYFGIEGAYDRELSPVLQKNIVQTDAVGHPIATLADEERESRNGRTVQLTVRRDIQHIVETKLADAVRNYGAESGDVIVMDPFTGAIIAAASYPTYDPSRYNEYPQERYANPIIAHGYEPGSTMKVLTVAAGIDAGVITPDTHCDICSGPIRIGAYTIRTWDEKYHPGTTVQEGLTHSDNTAMVFVGRKLGGQAHYEYLQKFGIGVKTGVDLQGEAAPLFRPLRDFGELDAATATFGQGIAVTPLQMLTAVNTIANGGVYMRPFVVQKVWSQDEEYTISPQVLRRVIATQSARIVASMMQTAASNGDARWTLPRQYPIAGKTSTAQIAIHGKYDENLTIASFVGFSPVENPLFSMHVRLVKPQVSIWGSETAAPLWFSIAKDLFVIYGIKQTM